MRERTVAAVLVFGGIVGGVTGGLLSAYWWDFTPDPPEYYRWTVAFYSVLGTIGGLIVAGLLVAVCSAFLELRGRGTLDRDA